MPIDKEYDALKRNHEPLIESRNFTVMAIEKYLRRFISIESNDPAMLGRVFAAIESAMQQLAGDGEEPLMNVLASHDNDAWRVIVFPRRKHRPSFYFAEGEDQILLSPAAVEMGGVCAVPLQKDFKRLDHQHVRQAFDEVTLPAEQFATLRKTLACTLASV